ncbi:anti-sigma factor [Pseudoduganella ginsengisoli]
MSFSEETLMAYADGELAPPEREQVERAMQGDPELAARVARHQALRSDVFAAFAPVLDEPVPARLAAAALPDKVADLAAVRAGAAAADLAGARAPRRAWSWAEWGGMAASLAIGVLAGSVLLGGGQSGVASTGGALVATGALADALSSQLASSAPGNAAVRIGVTFAAKDGALCRSFTSGTAAGLACRKGEQWTLPVVAEVEQGPAGEYRQAGNAMPAAVLDAIDARMAGQALDAEGERAAQRAGWARRK